MRYIAFGSREDEQAIKMLIGEMTEAFNQHDAGAATRIYTPDADLVTVRGERYKGAAAMAEGLAEIFATRARHATLRTVNVTVRFIKDEVALAHVTKRVERSCEPRWTAAPAAPELSIRVFAKDAGTWRVAAFHNTMVRPFGVSG